LAVEISVAAHRMRLSLVDAMLPLERVVAGQMRACATRPDENTRR
jgi:hypothetical protein